MPNRFMPIAQRPRARVLTLTRTAARQPSFAIGWMLALILLLHAV